MVDSLILENRKLECKIRMLKLISAIEALVIIGGIICTNIP